MIYQSLDDIFAMITREHTRFAEAVAPLNDTQTQFRSSADAWNIAEVVEHIAITNHGFLRITHRLLKQSVAAGAGQLTQLRQKHILLLDDGQQNPTKFPAPDVVKPQGGQRIADSLAKIEETYQGLQTVRPRLIETDCSAATFPHPAAGQLNLYQWLIVLGEHMDRHLQQIQRLQSAPGFPV
jgi:hypothetical protein